MRPVDVALNFSQAPQTSAPLLLHPAVQWEAALPLGPFATHAGSIWAIESGQVHHWDGKQWQHWPLALQDVRPATDAALAVLPDGKLLYAFMDQAQSHFRWLKHLGRASRNTRSPIYLVRSEDEGKSWSAPQLIQDGYSGSVRSMVVLESGRVVLSSQYLLPQQGRYVSLTYYSDDGGHHWQASNWLDAGGRGHHDGAIEGYLLPLKDGRLWYLLRTNWDRFWNAYSQDAGATWTHTKIGLPASSSPGALLRLQDGRIVLAYNPVGDNPPRRAGAFSQRAASWYRAELCLRISADEGTSWSAPVTVARCDDAWLSYPHLVEPEKGRIWLTTMHSGLRLNMKVEDMFA
ncbi:BNR repeat-like domain-containing protein [Sulfurivirga caldicuralii]|uniref:BNR repeat-like domain-containing protein n=1 Tax=Sulfurivirga caldicuralii TaxID=364032 RepID=A0A1N6EZ58_9GAMM|nr:sialidase family protein [Sulfurivirga caldicuralii]SIN88325.1 BNR repeat-like domain-containing protein [Sulfurivirga caldicuralii]